MRRAILFLLLAGCAADDRPRVTLQLVARDGEDPLEGAAQMRLELEAEPATQPEPRPIDPAGFTIDVELPDIHTLHRVRLFLESADGDVVSRGATPDAPLELLTDVPMKLLLSRVGAAGSVTIDGVPELADATTLGSEWIVGLDPDGAVAMLDLLAFVPVPDVAVLDGPRPGAAVADLGELRTIVVGGGEGARVYDASTNRWFAVDDGVDGGELGEPVVLSRAGGGAIAACGGRRDVIAFAIDGSVAWTAELAASRTGCAAAIAAGSLVVYGGGDEDAPAAEVVDLETHAARALVDAPDARVGAAGTTVGDRVLFVGGSRDGAPLADGTWLDPACTADCVDSVELVSTRDTAVAIGLDDDRALVMGSGEPPEVVTRGEGSTAIEGPAVDARGLLRADTGDVWWWGPDGLGVYADLPP